VRQINQNLNNHNEKGIFNKDNIQRITKDKVNVYLKTEEIIHEVSRAD
jgi:hypothetical protein